MIIKAETIQIILSREAKPQVKDILRDHTGQQATCSMTLTLPSEGGAEQKGGTTP